MYFKNTIFIVFSVCLKMENLPIIVLRKIFNKLTNLNEIIRCSLVCKNWRLAYETCKHELLCLYTSNFEPLNRKLAFTNGKVTNYNSFHFTNVKFIDSEFTRIHFSNIKKLIVYEYGHWQRENFGRPENSLQSQINHFKSLEYVEIQDDYFFKSKDEEHLNLPNLKVLILLIHTKQNQIVLNTPSLEVLTINSLDEVNLLFPQQLKYLTLNTMWEFQNYFVNLKCLTMFTHTINESLKNEFLKYLPNLKFLFIIFDLNTNEPPFLNKLESQKEKYNLNDLKVIEHEDLFDYKNWRNYIELKEQIHWWPDGFDVDFKELINCKVPFNYFEDNYLRVKSLKIGNVPDQSQLVAFLKKIDLSEAVLLFSYGCNLDQDFFDELPSYLSTDFIYIYGDLFYRLTDYTFLSKLNFRKIKFHFYQLPYQVVWNLLKNPSWWFSIYYKFEQFSDLQIDRAIDYTHDFVYQLYKNECSSYNDSIIIESPEITEEENTYFQMHEIADPVRYIEMKLKTKFT